MSCQPCGCDPTHHTGPYVCGWHASQRYGGLPLTTVTVKEQYAHLLEPNNRYTQEETSTMAGAHIGIGGAPTRTSTLPENPQERKRYPVASGVLDYFPDALVAVANVSWQGNEQHNPGQPLHWARGKSADESDTMIRHYLQRGTRDTDGLRHTAKMVWRALAYLQKEIEAEQAQVNLYSQGAAAGPAYKEPEILKECSKESEPAYRARRQQEQEAMQRKVAAAQMAEEVRRFHEGDLRKSAAVVLDRDHISQKTLDACGLEEGSYRLVVERERY